MKSYEVLKIACDFLELPIGDKLTGETITLSTKELKTRDQLLSCLNLVLDEINEEYLPHLTMENFEVEDFKIPLADFSKTPLNIYSLKNSHGRGVKYKVFDKYLLVFSDKVEIIYSYATDKVEINSDIDCRLPARVIAYGVAREYFLRLGLNDDADVFENRFKDSLKVLLRKKHIAAIPRRRWL